MKSLYLETQRNKSITLIKENNPVFYTSHACGAYRGKPRDFVLVENLNNLFEPIRTKALEYFKNNGISWWGGEKPTGHVLSSQIACLNHLFQIRNDKEAVLTILNNVSNEFIDVLPITTDKYDQAYIQFEAVSDIDHMLENYSTRGSNCTSIDALIYAAHKDGTKWLIPIEWKYTESYNNQNKATEGCNKNPQNCKGEVRKSRYTSLINSSNQLKPLDQNCYYFEPFYQLMRQTLWSEQMIKNKNNETLKADNFLHVHVIPADNSALLFKTYKCSSKNMETTWRDHLKDQSKYIIISPENLLNGLNKNKYGFLLDYLKTRYW